MTRLVQQISVVFVIWIFLCLLLEYPNAFAFAFPTTPSPRTTRARQHWRTAADATTTTQELSVLFPHTSRTAAATSSTFAAASTRLSMMPPIATELVETTTTPTTTTTIASSALNSFTTALDSLTQALTLTSDQAEAAAGPLFGASLFPYLAFLYFLSRPTVLEPAVSPGKGVTVGFAKCLLFVFLTIPAAIAAKVLYGVSLADSDWLHGSAESLLTLTNLVTVLAFRQALQAKEQQLQSQTSSEKKNVARSTNLPTSVTSYTPMVVLVVVGTLVAAASALVPALAADTTVHTPYLYGVLDLPGPAWTSTQPANALSVACWIIHISSLVEFLVAMGFCWRWADVTGRSQWKGLTWGLLPLHSSGITACTYHLFYNQIAVLVPLQALLTVVGNTTAAYAAWRIARASGWSPPSSALWLPEEWKFWSVEVTQAQGQEQHNEQDAQVASQKDDTVDDAALLVGFEDLGQALAADTDVSFLVKLFVGSAVTSYVIKYGEVYYLVRDFFLQDPSVYAGLAFILIPSLLNAYKWNQRSKDPTFEGWF
uniref:Uncharacterized protein n=1 Tax=Amphora coffeiformis TaxID=265554 RepID=A0A7S3L0V8_9STRA